MAQQYTPMMTHYLEIKKQHPDALIFYRLGDFYEMFFDDAKTAAHELDLVLTGRNAGVEERVPMCGVPHHAVTGYIQRLILKGYKVAIVEQLEDPAEAVGLVKRDVIRIVTPGTAIDEIMDEKASAYLAAVCDYEYGYALAVCEITTGETKLIELNHDLFVLKQTLLSQEIREVVLKSTFNKKTAASLKTNDLVTVSYCDEDTLNPVYKHLYENTEDVHQLEAIGILLNYLEATQKRTMEHLAPFELEKATSYLKMDYSTLQNLELVELGKTNARAITLWKFLDKARSAAGSRQLKKWIQRPLRDVVKINQRLDFISYLKNDFLARESLKEKLSGLYDLERLIARIAYGSANGKDLVRLQKSLANAPEIKAIVQASGVYPEYDSVDVCAPLNELLADCLAEDPPVSTHNGGIFRDGYNAELDEYRSIQHNSRQWILNLEQQEKERTGIKTLKVGYNKVFGYYIEVSKGAVSQVKEEWGYERKQTLTTGERYITAELKQQEDMILHAEERAVKLEERLFNELIQLIKTYLPKLQRLSAFLSVTDAVYALSVISSANNYVRPTFNEDKVIDVRQGRHPILESLISQRYVPNDILMDSKQIIQIITGPNMGGKSTYMRQCALIVVMAQIGCFVPARSASLPVFDQIFTRIGSTDDILAGQSTFMVEMTEANNALQNATEDSLILFDEIGRGTSTYDGMALAHAMIEYIDVAIKAKTLFSTHYHELTDLDQTIKGVRNKHVDVHEENGEITFLYKVRDGKANKSYGIHVASLAKLPATVIDRARDLLEDLESQDDIGFGQQVVVMEKTPRQLQEIKDTLQQVNPNNMTPIEALQLVMNLKEKAK